MRSLRAQRSNLAPRAPIRSEIATSACGLLAMTPIPGSCRDELVPFADHVAVLVHHRVPHRDMAHALGERAAVAHRTGLFDLFAGRAHDVARRRLSFHPVV